MALDFSLRAFVDATRVGYGAQRSNRSTLWVDVSAARTMLDDGVLRLILGSPDRRGDFRAVDGFRGNDNNAPELTGRCCPVTILGRQQPQLESEESRAIRSVQQTEPLVKHRLR